MLNAIKSAWLFYSLLIMAVLVIFFSMNDELLLNKTPICSDITENHTECIACGMTRGFAAITSGDFNRASTANGNSLFIFVLFAVNTMIFLVYGIKKLISKGSYYFQFGGNKL